jgi:hypothetical protein
MLVVTVDQRASRRTADHVDELLAWLSGRAPVVRPFERTAGDEVQGLLDTPGDVVRLSLDLVRAGGWSIGIGVGPVREPLPVSTRAGHGPAFTHARAAVTRAKHRPTGLAVSGDRPRPSADAEAVLDLLATVVARRSRHGWEAVDLAAQGLSQAQIGQRLGISKQAVSQRLAAAEWHLDGPGRTAGAHLLSEADGRLLPP